MCGKISVVFVRYIPRTFSGFNLWAYREAVILLIQTSDVVEPETRQLGMDVGRLLPETLILAWSTKDAMIAFSFLSELHCAIAGQIFQEHVRRPNFVFGVQIVGVNLWHGYSRLVPASQ